MKLTCIICGKEFEYDENWSQYARKKPVICGEFKDGKWVRNEECYFKYHERNVKNWWKDHPEKVREYNQQAYKKRQKKGLNQYKFKDERPVLKEKRRCRYPGCNRYTANNGQNYYYCEMHQRIMEYGCSSQYDEWVYG